uniref:Uncharacterized protein n=1 Tax=Timema monikensis TaxID=170555 RepID=A0A7R9ECD4_9NEOP|nr:unnamed protein product [Timema monikensis]
MVFAMLSLLLAVLVTTTAARGALDAAQEVSVQRVFQQMLKIRPPQVATIKGLARPPRHMLDLYHKYLSGRGQGRNFGNTVRNIVPKEAQDDTTIAGINHERSKALGKYTTDIVVSQTFEPPWKPACTRDHETLRCRFECLTKEDRVHFLSVTSGLLNIILHLVLVSVLDRVHYLSVTSGLLNIILHLDAETSMCKETCAGCNLKDAGESRGDTKLKRAEDRQTDQKTSSLPLTSLRQRSSKRNIFSNQGPLDLLQALTIQHIDFLFLRARAGKDALLGKSLIELQLLTSKLEGFPSKNKFPNSVMSAVPYHQTMCHQTCFGGRMVQDIIIVLEWPAEDEEIGV